MSLIRWLGYFLLLKFFDKRHTILDVGAGRGDFMKIAKLFGYKVVGVDKDPVRKDILKLDIRKDLIDEFDFCFCSQIIEHFDCHELENFVGICCRKRVIIITPVESEHFWYIKGVPICNFEGGHKRPYTIISLDYEFGIRGFKRVFACKFFNNVVWVGDKK